MDLYRSGYYTVLCNANIISEGITLPNASIGLLLRPTQSLALYIQQSMRVLTHDGNGKKQLLLTVLVIIKDMVFPMRIENGLWRVLNVNIKQIMMMVVLQSETVLTVSGFLKLQINVLTVDTSLRLRVVNCSVWKKFVYEKLANKKNSYS